MPKGDDGNYTMTTSVNGIEYVYRRTYDQLDHGTVNCYSKWGCRCPACKKRIKEWREDYLARTRVE